jgi:hypothetical protein
MTLHPVGDVIMPAAIVSFPIGRHSPPAQGVRLGLIVCPVYLGIGLAGQVRRDLQPFWR